MHPETEAEMKITTEQMLNKCFGKCLDELSRGQYFHKLLARAARRFVRMEQNAIADKAWHRYIKWCRTHHDKKGNTLPAHFGEVKGKGRKV